MEIPRGLKRFLDAPLQNIVSNKSNPLEKAISGIAIGLLTICSFGTYAIYAHKYFANRKVENLQNKLQGLIQRNETSEVESLLKRYPAIKGNVRNAVSLAIRESNLEMLKLLVKNNFDVDDKMDGETPLYKVLEGSYKHLKDNPIRYEIAKFLIENGAKLKVIAITPPSPLALAMKLWNENPEEAKKIIALMLEKGGRLEKEDIEYLKENLSDASLDGLIDFFKLVKSIKQQMESEEVLRSLIE